MPKTFNEFIEKHIEPFLLKEGYKNYPYENYKGQKEFHYYKETPDFTFQFSFAPFTAKEEPTEIFETTTGVINNFYRRYHGDDKSTYLVWDEYLSTPKFFQLTKGSFRSDEKFEQVKANEDYEPLVEKIKTFIREYSAKYAPLKTESDIINLCISDSPDYEWFSRISYLNYINEGGLYNDYITRWKTALLAVAGKNRSKINRVEKEFKNIFGDLERDNERKRIEELPTVREKLKANFPKSIKFPENLGLVADFHDSHSDPFEKLGGTFEFDLHGKFTIEAWIDDDRLYKQFAVFGQTADLDMFCIWKCPDGSFPVVKIGQGQMADILTVDIDDFITILAINYMNPEDYSLWSEKPNYAIYDIASENIADHNNDLFQAFYKEKIKKDIPESGVEILKRVNDKYEKDFFYDWLSKAYPEWNE